MRSIEAALHRANGDLKRELLATLAHAKRLAKQLDKNLNETSPLPRSADWLTTNIETAIYAVKAEQLRT